MKAFLLSWLSQLNCLVAQPPHAALPFGTELAAGTVDYAAAQLGIPVQPLQRHVALSLGSPAEDSELHLQTLTVVGDRCFGTAEHKLVSYARRLANAAGVDLLAVRFSAREQGFVFLGIE